MWCGCPPRVDMVGRRWEMEADTGTTQESSGRRALVVERFCWAMGPRPLLTQSLFPGDR